MSISNYLENKILDKVFNNTNFTVSSVYVALHTDDPGELGSNEVSGNGYSRQLGSFTTASGGGLRNDSDLFFGSMPACTVTHIGIWSSGAGGDYLWSGETLSSKEYALDDTAVIYTNNLVITLD